MSGHTPGPWAYREVRNGTDAILVFNPRKGHQLAVLRNGNEANARLIAAAPELLEACKTMADELLALRQYIAEIYGQTQAAPCLGAESAEYQGRVAIARATQPLTPTNED